MGELVNFKRKSSYKIPVISALIILTILVLVIVNNITPIFKRVGTKKQSVRISNASYSVGKSGNAAILWNKDEVLSLAGNGNEIWKIKLKYSKPILKSNDNYIAVADIEGTEFKLISNGREKLTHTSDGEIITVAVNKSGYYAIASKEKGYRSRVSVFDNSGKQIYAWYTADYDVIDVALSNDNNKMSVAALNCNENESFSSVLLFSFNSKDYKVCTKSDTNLISGIYYSGRNIICIGDKATFCFSHGGSRLWEINYGGRTLQEFAFYEGGVLAMGFTKSSLDSLRGGSVVEIYSSFGRLKGKYETKNPIEGLDVEGKDVFISTEEKSVVVNDKGNIISTLPIHSVSDCVIFDGNILLPLGDTVELYKY